MKNLAFVLLVGCSFALAVLDASAQSAKAVAGSAPPLAGTYIITNTDSTGAFVSRGVITLNADRTLSVVDSGQGGPTYFFSSQLGTWSPSGQGGVGRTIDFDFAPASDVARLDYTFAFGAGTISGTMTIYYFPLTANPLGSGGTFGGTFNFTGYQVTP